MKGDMALDGRKRCCLEGSWPFVPFSREASSSLGWQCSHVELGTVSISVCNHTLLSTVAISVVAVTVCFLISLLLPVNSSYLKSESLPFFSHPRGGRGPWLHWSLISSWILNYNSMIKDFSTLCLNSVVTMLNSKKGCKSRWMYL